MGFVNTIITYARLKREPGIEKKVKFGISGGKVNQLVELDTADFILNDQWLMMVNPGNKQQITDIGEFNVDIDRDGKTDITGYRFYMIGEDNSESFLQSFESPIEHMDGPDYVLFRRTATIDPADTEDWEEWIGDGVDVQGMMYSEVFIIGDTEFTKVFQSPINFVEVIHEANDTTIEETNICQLFSREVITNDDPVTEYAMVSIEDEEQVSVYVGIKMPLAGIQFL